MAITQRCLHTRVAHATRLNVHTRITRRGGDRRLEGLIARVGQIPRSAQSHVVPQPGVKAHLPGLRPLGIELSDFAERRRQPLLRRLVIGISRGCQKAREGNTHRRERRPELQIAERVRHVKRRRRNPRKSHRRIEERLLRRSSQLRGPVVAARDGQIEHRPPTDLNRAEERLRLLLPAPFLGARLLAVEVEDRKEVRNPRIANRPPIREFAAAHVVDRGTDIGNQRPLLAKSLVHIGNHIGIDLLIGVRDLRIVALRTAFGDCRIRRSVELLRIDRIGVVNSRTAADIQPRQDVIRQRGRGHVAFLVRITRIAIGNPVGILHAQVTAFALRPVLNADLAGRIPTLEDSDSIKIVSAREKIG